MNCDSIDREVMRFVRQLAGLQGSSDLSVFARRFSRSGPADTITSYEEQRRCFPADSIPETIGLPSHPDEIVIDVTGRLRAPAVLGDLIDQIRAASAEAPTGRTWDVRATVDNDSVDDDDVMGIQSNYRFTVFTDAGGDSSRNWVE